MEVQDVPEGEGEGMSYGEYGGGVLTGCGYGAGGADLRTMELPRGNKDGPVKLGLYK